MNWKNNQVNDCKSDGVYQYNSLIDKNFLSFYLIKILRIIITHDITKF